LSDDPKGKDEPLAGPPAIADVLGKTSVETIIPNPVVTGACGDTTPPVADRAKATETSLPSTSVAQVRKHPHIVAKRLDHNRHTSEVITQIKFPHSPLDLLFFLSVFFASERIRWSRSRIPILIWSSEL
jgi:hypothetical protein